MTEAKEIILPDGFEVDKIEDGKIILKNVIPELYLDSVLAFQQLLTCKRAYWLKDNWNVTSHYTEDMYGIILDTLHYDFVVDKVKFGESFFVFPTKTEVLDFLNNFKDLFNKLYFLYR